MYRFTIQLYPAKLMLPYFAILHLKLGSEYKFNMERWTNLIKLQFSFAVV